MGAIVPYHRTNPGYDEAHVSAPTRGRTFRDAALLLHWARAHGSQIIPGHRLGVEISGAGSADIYYRVHPRGTAIARVWVFGIRQENPANPPTGAEVDISLPGGSVVSYTPEIATAFGGVVTRRVYLEELTAKDASEAELAINIAHVAGTAKVFVDSISCFELPRAALTLDETDFGVDLETVRPGAPMYEGTNRSVHGVAQGWAATDVRRHLVSLFFPEVETASATFVDVFELPIPILPSKWKAADTTRAVTWRVYASASDGTTSGEFRITTGNSANTSTVTLPTGSASDAWLERGRVTADCERLTDAEGLPSGGRETIQLAFRRTAGAGTVRALGLVAWEADTLAT